MLSVGFAQLEQVQGAIGGVQGVAHQVMRAVAELQLNRVVQLIARFGLHQAGVG